MILEDRLTNNTLANARVFPTTTSRGAPGLVAVVKLALRYDLDGNLSLASREPRASDDLDGLLGLVGPDDLAFEKSWTDIGLTGVVEPPLTATRELIAILRVGTLEKSLRVTGKRTPKNEIDFIREPVPLGLSAASQLEIVSTRVLGEHGAKTLATLGPVPSGMEPRKRRGGTYDASWAETRAPLPPVDRDPLADSWAHEQLRAARPLTGTEPIEIVGIYAQRNRLRLLLPRFTPQITWRVQDNTTRVTPSLDGLLIDARAKVVELTWRSGIQSPKKQSMVDEVLVESLTELPDSICMPLSSQAVASS